MADTVPRCPTGWIVSTQLPTHLSLRYRGDGRSLLVRPTEPTPTADDPEAVDAWTVKGLAGYGPSYPIFVEGVTHAEAITTAETVMETIAGGESPSAVRYSEQPVPVDESTADTPAKTDEKPDQASLSTFAVDDE